jgi:hypothetical protein
MVMLFNKDRCKLCHKKGFLCTYLKNVNAIIAQSCLLEEILDIKHAQKCAAL